MRTSHTWQKKTYSIHFPFDETINSKMLLTDLPSEILAMIPHHLDSHADHRALTQACKLLKETCTNTKLPFRADFDPISSEYRLPRHHTFIANIVTQLGDWMNEPDEPKELECRREMLKTHLYGGMDGLLNFAAQYAWVTLDEIRAAKGAPDEIIPFLNKLYAVDKPPCLGNPELTSVHNCRAIKNVTVFIVYSALFRYNYSPKRSSGFNFVGFEKYEKLMDEQARTFIR